MFKARKKRQHQQKDEIENQIFGAPQHNELNLNLLNDVQLSHDFRSSVIIPELNKDLDSNQQRHLVLVHDQSELPPKPPIMTNISHDPKRTNYDGSKQYKDLAAWRQQRKHRYSNGLFGGKQRNKPKPTKRYTEENTEENIQQIADYSFIEEDYQPDSDTEENFFFQDFSYNSKSPKPRKKNIVKKKQHNKSSNHFNLSSFAKDLHDNRLSVIQRDSKIIMTEQDELELQKLLEFQRQRMSMMYPELDNESIETLQIVPPLPSLEMFEPHQFTKKEKEIQTPTTNSDQDSVTTTSASTNESVCDNYLMDEFAKKCVEEPEGNDQRQIRKDEDEEQQTNGQTEKQVKKQVEEQVREHVAQEEDWLKEEVNRHWREGGSNKIALSDEDDIKVPQANAILEPINVLDAVVPDFVAINRLPEITPTSSNSRGYLGQSVNNPLSASNVCSDRHPVPKTRTQPSAEQITRKNSARKSNGMNDLISSSCETPTSTPFSFLNEGFLNPVTNLEAKHKKQHPQKNTSNGNKASRSLFGSLRQTNKSQNGANPLKGLVRNLSSKEPGRSQQSQKESVGMSRAAMAVIQHNVAKQEKDQAFCNIFEESEEMQREKKPRPDNNNRLVQLLVRASSSTRGKKSNATKIVNMNTESKSKRAEVIRKTIIYVQPDSLQHLLKPGAQHEDIPALPPIRNTIASGSSSSFDEDTDNPREYVTATKVSRQTSVRKRVVDTQQSGSPIQRHGSARKRFQLQSMNKSTDEVKNLFPHNDYMEGVELREMSDGTVLWGIVKKQGSRKSFYAPNLNKSNRHTSDNEVLHRLDAMKKTANTAIINPPTSKAIVVAAPDGSLSPPPIPRRSPRRRDTVKKTEQPKTETNVYYSDKVTLPNLLKMMQGHDQYPGDMLDEEVEVEEDYAFDEAAMASVDDQLDNFMRDLLCQQQEQEQKQRHHI